ncbi:MAG: MGMT family protein [Deltaproteobacteria bacterium]|nr:MGMT family protein [Deltaproteobacteria bacterium]
MTSRKKSWREKLDGARGLPKVVPIPEGMGRKWGTGTIVIPTPREVDRIMKGVPKGKLITIPEIRRILARRHKATIGCPITTGIFAMIAAHAAREALQEGAKRVTPYWRTLKAGGEINAKYPGGLEDQRKRLLAEGHRVIRKGRKYIVEDYESHLIGS